MADEAVDPRRLLAALPRLGHGIGLHRVAMLTCPLLVSAWGQEIDAIKVTGSNGKGTVAAMTAAILRRSGVPSGLFVSPHVHRFRERITLDGEPVPMTVLADAVAWVLRRWRRYAGVHRDEVLSAFEATTASALRVFADTKPTALVLEAGIGGRNDPTRLVPGGLSALVSVDHEHVDLLGGTLASIADDKAALAAPGSTLIVGRLAPSIQRAVDARCADRNVTVVKAESRVAVRRLRWRAAGMVADLVVDGEHYENLVVGTLGRHQVENAALAILLSRRWLHRHRPSLPDKVRRAAVRQALAAVALPGRFERCRRRPDVFVDTAHTPAATQALATTVRRRFRGRRVVLVAGISTGKDAASLLGPLLPLAAHVVVTRAAEAGAPVASVASAVERSRPRVPWSEVEVVALAVAMAVDRARAIGAPVLVAGGLFLAREAAAALA